MKTRKIIRLLDQLHELEIDKVTRFVSLALDDDPVLLDLTQAFERGRICRSTYCSGVRDRVNAQFREDLLRWDIVTNEWLASVHAQKRNQENGR